MDAVVTQSLAEMGVSLTELAIKGTVSAISKRIKLAKDIKDIEKLRTTYDEIINEILQEREDAVRIAQAYKTELERIEISDEDITHLHNTIGRVIEIIKSFQVATALAKGSEEVSKVKMQVAGYEQIKELISVDTLKTMQLLGFNYKAAIGEPLTEICANAISNIGSKNKSSNVSQKKR
ncbi:MAG: hypothetical protein ACI4SL_10030 [Candidatus Ornithospirochaeta sp.]